MQSRTKFARRSGMAALVLWLAAACQGQSVADAARQQKAKQSATPSAERHVITNEDIHSSGASSAAAGTAQDQSPSRKDPAAKASSSTPATSQDSKPSAETVRETIRAQKGKVSELEAEMKELQAKVDTWKARDCRAWVHQDNRSACDVPPELNAEKRRLDAELEQERKTLEEMQEKARRMGYGNSVYEPD